MVTTFRMVSLVVVMSAFMLAACGNNNTQNENEDDSGANNSENESATELGQEELSLPYVSWASTIASVNVVKAVLEDIGYAVNLQQVEAGAMFSGIASGSSDFSVGAVTMPNTHADYWDEYGDQIDDIGITMENSVSMGLTVPSYVDIDSIEDMAENKDDIGEEVDWTIVGIDPGAGQMDITENDVMPGYGLGDWTLQSSSGPAMTAELKGAIDSNEPIIVTLWEPHWAFIEWNLKYLEDPENYYGEPDSIHAIAREGLKEDAPAAYKILDQFQWESEDMGEVMSMIHDGMEEEEAGEKWVNDNQDKVETWVEGVE